MQNELLRSLSPAPTATPVGKGAAAGGALLAADGVCFGTCQGHAAVDRRGIVSSLTRRQERWRAAPAEKRVASPAYDTLLRKALSGIALSRATRNSSLHGIRIPEQLVVVLMYQWHVQDNIMQIRVVEGISRLAAT